MRITDPALRSAMPVVEAFAGAKGLTCEARSRWDEHLYVGWEDAGVCKGLFVSRYLLSVWARARLTQHPTQEGRGMLRHFGTASPQAPAWENFLTAELDRAWAWLKSVDSAAVIAFGEMRRRQIAEEIVPAIRRSADELGMRILHEYELNTELVWPQEDVEFHLSIIHSQEQTGIAFIGHRRVRRGLLRRRIWVGWCELGLDIEEWAGSEELGHRIGTAKARIEDWVPDSNATGVWVG